MKLSNAWLVPLVPLFAACSSADTAPGAVDDTNESEPVAAVAEAIPICAGPEPPPMTCARVVCSTSNVWGYAPIPAGVACGDTGSCDGAMHCIAPSRPTSPEYRASDYAEEAIAGFHGSPWDFHGMKVRMPLPGGGLGRGANSTGRPIGGGAGYGDWIATTGTIVVDTSTELTQALDDFEQSVRSALTHHTTMPRRTIYVADGADIDIGSATLRIAPGLTLASGRGRNGSGGAILRSTIDVFSHAFQVLTQEDLDTTQALTPVRITGLRFIGPDPSENAPDCSSDGRYAIRAVEERASARPAGMVDRVLEIDNNELSSWPRAGIEIAGIAHAFVHHNYVHHSRRHADGVKCAIFNLSIHALGYGVATNNARTYIEANRFAYNRHSVASRGDTMSDYVAIYNAVEVAGPSFDFDCHGGEDRGDGTHDACRRVVIAYNTVLDDARPAVNIRGNPTIGAWVVDNQLAGASSSIEQTKTGSSAYNMFIYNNVYDYAGH